MITPFDSVQVADLLKEILGNRGSLYSSAQSSDIMLISQQGLSPIFVTVDGEVLRIRAGSFLALNVGQDVPASMNVLSEVIGALLDGDAEEQYGVNSSGALGPLGWRIWYPGGERQGEFSPFVSEPIARVKLPSW